MPTPESKLNSDDQGSNILSPEDPPGLPLFRTWPAVYAFVLAVFLGVVILLATFTHVFTGAAK